MKSIFILTFLLFSSSSCTTSSAVVNYEGMQVYSNVNAGNLTYKEIGKVSGRGNSFIFDSCDEIAQKAVADLLADARARGANGLINVTYGRKNDTRSEPFCTKRWLFFYGTARVSAMAVNFATSDRGTTQNDHLKREIDKNDKAPSGNNDLLKKAKKCQKKGGIWVNDTCQISVEE